MIKLALARVTLVAVVSASACSLFVDADRSTVKDDLYQPSVIPVDDAGDMDADDAEPDAAKPDDTGAAEGGAGGAADGAGMAGDGGSAD